MPVKLTATEEAAMRAVWKTGEANVKTILDNMEPPLPPYTTLASTVKNLEKKGYLGNRLVGNTYLYTPLITAQEHTRLSITAMVKNHFDNSYKELVAFFAEQKKISAKELKEIIDLIENRKK